MVFHKTLDILHAPLTFVWNARSQLLGLDYIFGPEVMEDGYNVAVIRERLTRNLGPLYGDIYDEIRSACDRLIPATEDGERICRRPLFRDSLSVSMLRRITCSVVRRPCTEDHERNSRSDQQPSVRRPTALSVT